MTGIAGQLVVNGQAATENLNVSDQDNNGAESSFLTDTRLWGLGMPGSTATLGGITYAGISALDLKLGTRTDTVNVRATNAGTVSTIETGPGSPNTVNVGSAAPSSGGLTSGILGLLVISGQAPSDTLNVDDTADASASTGLLTATRLTGLNMGDATRGISYSSVEFLNVNLGVGGNTFNVQSTNASTISTLSTGTGAAAKTVNVGSVAPAVGGNVNSVAGSLIVQGQGASDTLNVDDTGDADANVGNLTNNGLTGLGMASGDASKGIEYHNVEALNINLGQGGDLFTIVSTFALTTTVLSTNGGNDAVAVQTIAGPTTVNTGEGSDTVNVGSLATPAGNANGNVRGISASLTVNGQGQPIGGIDLLDVDDTGETLPTVGQSTSTQITGLGMSVGITYGTLESLKIHLGQNNDVFTIASTHAGSTLLEGRNGDDTLNVQTIAGLTTVDGSAGDDTIQVGTNAGVNNRDFEGLLSGIGAALTVTGGTANDVNRLIVDDSGDLSNQTTGVLTGTTINGVGMAAGGITYSAIQILNIRLGQGDDHFHVASTDPTVTQVNGGPGNDLITVQSVQGPTQIDGDDPMVPAPESFAVAGKSFVLVHRLLESRAFIGVAINGVPQTYGVGYTFVEGSKRIDFASPVNGTVDVVYNVDPARIARTGGFKSGVTFDDTIQVNVDPTGRRRGSTALGPCSASTARPVATSSRSTWPTPPTRPRCRSRSSTSTTPTTRPAGPRTSWRSTAATTTSSATTS